MSKLDVNFPAELNDVFLQCIISNPTIYDLIFAHSSPATIIRFSWTCTDALTAVHSYYRRAYNINRHLSHFFRDPEAFRVLQARTNTLISGSNALQFIDRTFYPESDLDIYVPLRHSHEVADWLLGVGYVFRPHATQSEDLAAAIRHMQVADAALEGGFASGYRMRGVVGVCDFLKRRDEESAVDAQPLKIQVIVAARTPAEVVINFHSTCVMNVISHDTAYSFYPHATFESRLSLVCPTEGPAQEGALQKYTERGWRLICERPEVEDTLIEDVREANSKILALAAHEPSFLPGSRWLNDSTSWALPLHPILPTHASENSKNSPIASTNWQLAYQLDDDDSPSPKMRYCLIRSPFLKHVYLLTDELLLLAIWSALKGIRSGRTVMQRVLDRAKHRKAADFPRHDDVLRTECEAYREAVRTQSLPQTLWKKGPPGDLIYSL
ncbi:hypothetical protein EW146_g7487 [Bondarzewia mesenterica]|uniref:Uncharacterized protein n=1 Tax=Bondarzewia mesenterica TaxID=1095465 RepID=A0A4S4LL63_9AGAM|nr:hypothetical protein EW146_g7487 [Bondarzewia mesenterica]